MEGLEFLRIILKTPLTREEFLSKHADYTQGRLYELYLDWLETLDESDFKLADQYCKEEFGYGF